MSRHIKSRTGCRVCKTKRLKCDETAPACRNCINRGIACPGYRQVLRWSTKYEHPSVKSATAAKSPDLNASVDSTFSELATAVKQSIGSPSPTPSKAEPDQAPGSERLARILHAHQAPPPQPSQSPGNTYATRANSLSPAPSMHSPSSSVYLRSSSPLPMALPMDTPSMVASSPPKLVGTGWQMPPLGSICDLGDIGDEDVDAEDEHFALTMWTPDRVELGPPPATSPVMLSSPPVALSPPRALSLPGTALVELWFKSVCGMWAAMDSPSNPFRRLCSSLWSSNEAVFFSMQTMAAASLPNRPPNVSEIVRLAPQMSTQALISELQNLFTHTDDENNNAVSIMHKKKLQFPSGLLTSLFCMSSSLSWIDARQLGIQYLRNARSVIDLLDLYVNQLTLDDRELLEFFRGCLLYEEMVRSVVTDDQEDIQALLDWQVPSLDPQDIGVDDVKVKACLGLHAWAGVPIVLVALFGKVMALCRRSRKRWRHTATTRATYELLRKAMEDIQEGKALEGMLQSVSIPAILDDSHQPSFNVRPTASEIGSESFPIAAAPASEELKSDIHKASEAFRLLSLLQLYQTFPDLVQGQPTQETWPTESNPRPREMGAGVDDASPMYHMALRTVRLLEGISPDSPMRCLQPLLCICAGSALRMDEPGSSPSDVLRARAALRKRLARLEQNLPPRPITVARQLLDTVWLRYDSDTAPARSHWLDIMSVTEFESVFG